MKDEKKLEDSAAFLDLMDKKERKEWEKRKLEEVEKTKETESKPKKETRKERKSREKAKKIQTEEVPVAVESVIPVVEAPIIAEIVEVEVETDEVLNSNTHDIAVGEINATPSTHAIVAQESNITPSFMEQIVKEEPVVYVAPESPKSSLIGLTGFSVILSIGYYVYLYLYTNYNEGNFLIVNSFFIISMTLVLAITALCNQKYARKFSMFNLFLLLSFITFNFLSIFNY